MHDIHVDAGDAQYGPAQKTAVVLNHPVARQAKRAENHARNDEGAQDEQGEGGRYIDEQSQIQITFGILFCHILDLIKLSVISNPGQVPRPLP
ncbi:MAG: hypothetical protein Q9P14_13365 [candidate division KSB1 bacterium]|nr:hypothetical protein [candidate division KSB1 bacterium]